jgi:uncharacterized protein involved in exopolysaccharide biosynthesis
VALSSVSQWRRLDAVIQFAKRYAIAQYVLLPSLVVATGASLLPERYESETQFLPDVSESSLMSSTLAGLASQLNIRAPVAPGQRPEFYADLVRSRSILDSLSMVSLATSGDSSVSLVSWYGHDDQDIAEALSRTRRALLDATKVKVNTVTGVVTVRFTARDPVLAASSANALVAIVNDFNLTKYRSRARARREFTERRLAETSDQLAASEQQLISFRERNRVITSPELQQESERLQRAVRVNEQLYLQLRQNLEDARIEEVRDTPVLTVIDPAVPATEASFPRPRLFFVLTLILTILLAFARVHLR